MRIGYWQLESKTGDFDANLRDSYCVSADELHRTPRAERSDARQLYWYKSRDDF
jgi:hypothetical protein